MKKLQLTLLTSLIGLLCYGQTARLQVIHNSPDDIASEVDVYLNGAILLDDFAFRTATPFIDAPAGVQITVDIAPGSSTDVAQSIATFTYTLAAGETYILVADGITGLSPTMYSPAPAFNLEVYALGREAASLAGNTDVLVHHGSTDAPTVDVAEVGVGAGIVVDNASYPAFTNYLELGTADYALAIQDENNTVTVATFAAPLASLGLEDAAITVLASGFLNPSMNGDGPAFGLYVALASGGDLIALPLAVPNDNPCDAIMLEIDGSIGVYTNAFATVALGEDAITPEQTGCQTQDGWCTFESGIDNSVWFSFTATSAAININTCLDGNTIDTQLALYEATDCTDFSTLTLLAANDDLIGDCDLGDSPYGSGIDFCGLNVGQTYWILVDSYNAEQGEFAISLTESTCPTARLQVIHNSPDDAATVVDVYLNGALLLDDLTFRTATTFIDAPAEVEFILDIAPGTSMDVSESIATFPVTLAAGETYIVVADGITGLSSTVYTPAPAFGLEVYDMGREAATSPSNTDVLVHHGSTDAPTVDVIAVGVGSLVDGASYTDFAGYLELGTADYQLAIQDDANTVTVATYEAPLSTLGLDGAAITVLASGFLNPVVNGNGPAFGLYVALASGGDLVPLPTVTSTQDYNAVEFNMYPNPVVDQLFVNSTEILTDIIIMDAQGRVVMTLNGRTRGIDVSALESGIYLLQVSTGDRISNQSFMKD